MQYVGVDLHKKSITLCVVAIVEDKRKVVCRKSFECRNTEGLRAFFAGLDRFQVVVEATAHYEWFFLLIEDLADRLVLAHPKHLRIIAATVHKTDKIDAWPSSRKRRRCPSRKPARCWTRSRRSGR